MTALGQSGEQPELSSVSYELLLDAEATQAVLTKY